MAINQSALDFAHAARVLGREARRRGLVAPSYRCPPRIVGVQRSVRRLSKGGAVVAVQLKGRPWLAVRVGGRVYEAVTLRAQTGDVTRMSSDQSTARMSERAESSR